MGALLIHSIVKLVQPAPEAHAARKSPEPLKETSEASAKSPDADFKLSRDKTLLPWEKAVDEILSSTDDPGAVFSKLAGLVKESPIPAQGMIARHLVNLATDENFAEILPLLTDRTLNGRLHVLLGAELMNRTNAIKLPALLDIASCEWHPFREKALTFLCQLTRQDAGQDWAEWRKIIAGTLAEKP